MLAVPVGYAGTAVGMPMASKRADYSTQEGLQLHRWMLQHPMNVPLESVSLTPIRQVFYNVAQL